jgi:hypothetical protein
MPFFFQGEVTIDLIDESFIVSHMKSGVLIGVNRHFSPKDGLLNITDSTSGIVNPYFRLSFFYL